MDWIKRNFWIVNLASIALSSVFLARATVYALEGAVLLESAAPAAAARPPAPPPPPQTARSKDVTPILERNVFCSTCPPIIPRLDTEQAAPATEQKTSLPLELLTTLVSADRPEWSIAVLRNTTSKEMGAFGLGSAILDGRVAEIRETRVYLEVQNRLEYLDMGPNKVLPEKDPNAGIASGDDPLAGDLEKGIRKITDTQYEVSRGLIDKILGDTNYLARSARIVPAVVDGKAVGFRMYGIRPNGVYSRIGFQNGDTISAINGYDMTSPDKALEVYTKIKSASHLTVAVSRRNTNATLDYTIR